MWHNVQIPLDGPHKTKTAVAKVKLEVRACHVPKQVCVVQLPTYADNVALPAFARRTLLPSSGLATIDLPNSDLDILIVKLK